MSKTIVIAYASNDDNGSDTHIARAVDISDSSETIFSLWDGRCTFRYLKDKSKIRISRKVFPVISHRTWWGNMMWNAVRVDVETAEIIAEYLRGQGDWRCEMGDIDLWESDRKIEL